MNLILKIFLQNRSERLRESDARPENRRIQAADRPGLQDQDGRNGKHPDQAVQQGRRLREEHDRGERREQRHPQAAQRPPRGREALQTVRHEKVPAERQPRAQEELPGPQEARVPVHLDHRLRQERGRTPGQPHLDYAHQRRRSRNAQGQNAHGTKRKA